MTWFAAHVVIGTREAADESKPWEVMENVYLLHADTPEAALVEANRRGEEEAAASDTLRIDGGPALVVFAGVRKLISVANEPPLDQDADRPDHGTEITYSEFQVPDEATLRAFANGEDVNVRYWG